MKIWIDNGHGINTLGKRSPDGRLMEWKYTREIARRVVEELKSKGYDSELLVTEDNDISLGERCRRANKDKDSILVSIHVNAASSDGQWHSAQGWSGWVYTNCSSKSKRLADIFFDEAKRLGLKTRQPLPTQKYWTANFYILKNSAMPSLLTENLFQDSLEDVNFLLSNEGRKKIVDLHVNAIVNYINSI